jgi:hypothetical protein
MRQVVLKYGIRAGLIIVALMVISFTLVKPCDGDYGWSMVLGYATMLISLSMIFFGIRTYRDQFSDGSITFGRGLLIGLYISLIASVFYIVGWKIYSAIAIPDFADRYVAHAIDVLKKSGASEAAIAAKTKELADWKIMYSNPIVEIAMTFIEIFPVGFLISLICAFILKRKKPAAA